MKYEIVTPKGEVLETLHSDNGGRYFFNNPELNGPFISFDQLNVMLNLNVRLALSLEEAKEAERKVLRNLFFMLRQTDRHPLMFTIQINPSFYDEMRKAVALVNELSK